MVEIMVELYLQQRINFAIRSCTWDTPKLILHTLEDRVVEIGGWQNINGQGEFYKWNFKEEKGIWAAKFETNNCKED